MLWYLVKALIFQWLMILNVFMCLVFNLISFLVKCLFQPLPILKLGCFLTVEFREDFIYIQAASLLDI